MNKLYVTLDFKNINPTRLMPESIHIDNDNIKVLFKKRAIKSIKVH